MFTVLLLCNKSDTTERDVGSWLVLCELGSVEQFLTPNIIKLLFYISLYLIHPQWF